MPRVVTVKLQVHLMTERPLIRFKDELFLVWNQENEPDICRFNIHHKEDGRWEEFDAEYHRWVAAENLTLWARMPLARNIQAQFDLGYGEEKEIGSE